MSSYQFTHLVYQRPFRQPLKTSHGEWTIREGIIVELTNDRGKSCQGEIAPIPWFGSESIECAIEWCQQVGDNITTSQIDRIPDDLPACQFGFGSALLAFNPTGIQSYSPLDFSALLPAGAAAIAKIQALANQGYSTFKWKIGVLPIAEELAIWRQLIAAVPANSKLRLDANGGLTLADAECWLQHCDREPKIEFIEQPLGVEEIDRTIELASKYHTPIALDESVTTIDRLQSVYDRGWRGIYVIKPGIAGFPWRLAEVIKNYQLDVVFSSVLETDVGKSAALQLAASLNLDRRFGFGVDEWFDTSI